MQCPPIETCVFVTVFACMCQSEWTWRCVRLQQSLRVNQRLWNVMRRWTHPLYHLHSYPVWLSSLPPLSTGLSLWVSILLPPNNHTLVRNLAAIRWCADFVVWAALLPITTVGDLSVLENEISLLPPHMHTHTHLLIPHPLFLHKPLLFSTHYNTFFPSISPSPPSLPSICNAAAIHRQ